ncbi:hypothetical protein CBW54_01270 [Yersinia kristensenii]|nr:hypothetical protein CBW54_01270 [Yersinia kristensenii]
MIVVKFQGLDNYACMGLYALCEQFFGNQNIRKSNLSTEKDECDDTVILFRSKLASLSECTCHLIEKNMVVITILDEGWDRESSKGGVFISLSDPVRMFEDVIRRNIEIHQRKSLSKRCLYCQMIKNLSKEDINVISMLRKGLQPCVIASVLGTSHKTVSYYKHRIMKKVGTQNTVELHRFISALAR